MIRNLIDKKVKAKGFTLIELIIVIAIIAILAAVALPKFMQIRKDANVKVDIANAKNIQIIVATLVAEEKLSHDQDITVTSSYTMIASRLQSIEVGKAKEKKGKNFVAKIDANGEVEVYLESVDPDNLVYPNGATPWNK